MSSEEFFMYLTIGLIVFAPISVRVYRYLTMKRVKHMLHEQFGRQAEAGKADSPEKRI